MFNSLNKTNLEYKNQNFMTGNLRKLFVLNLSNCL